MKRKLRQSVLCGVATIALALPLAVTAPFGVANAALPTEFQIDNYTTGLTAEMDLTDFAYTPDSGFFSLGKSGQVNWTSPDGEVRAIHTFDDVITEQDLGALSITLGHRYGDEDSGPSVWIVRIADNGTPLGKNLLSEFPVLTDEAGNPIGFGDERRVLWFDNHANTHTMDDVVVDPKDGTLWLSVGDNADFTGFDERAFDAQNPDSPYGRIMHINEDGSGVAETNPEFDPAHPHAWYSKTYAKGFRNPFRIRLNPTLGLPMVGDVGWNTAEEQNVVRSGGNYGWPCFEGNAPTPEYSDRAECDGVTNDYPPLFAYDRDSAMGTSTVAGLVYQGSDGDDAYPDSFVGTYFWADFTGQKIYTMQINEDGTGLVTEPDPAGWATTDENDPGRSAGMPVSLKYAPNGDIAYADIASNQVRRITYNGDDDVAPEVRIDTVSAENDAADQPDLQETMDAAKEVGELEASGKAGGHDWAQEPAPERPDFGTQHPGIQDAMDAARAAGDQEWAVPGLPDSFPMGR